MKMRKRHKEKIREMSIIRTGNYEGIINCRDWWFPSFFVFSYLAFAVSTQNECVAIFEKKMNKGIGDAPQQAESLRWVPESTACQFVKRYERYEYI